MTKLVVEVYGKKRCSLCLGAVDVVKKVNKEVPFHFKYVDIDSTSDLKRKFEDEVPTIFISGKKAFKFKVDKEEFKKRVRKEFIKAGMSRVSSKRQDLTG